MYKNETPPTVNDACCGAEQTLNACAHTLTHSPHLSHVQYSSYLVVTAQANVVIHKSRVLVKVL